MAKEKKTLCKSRKSVHFPEKIHSYLIACQDDFSNYPSMLDELTDIGDTLLSEDDMNHLRKFCDEILTISEIVYDYSMYDKWKSHGIRQDELRKFAKEFAALIQCAWDNNELIWSVGE